MTVPLDKLGRARPNRAFEIKARKQAMAAARELIAADGRLNRDEIAAKHQVTPSGVSLAVIILKHGTEAEIASVDNGEQGLRPVYDEVVTRIPVDQRIKSKTRATISAERKEQVKNDAATWKQLRQAIELICGMPLPADVVAIARRNGGRASSLDRKIIAAYSWLTEFSDAWTK